MNNAKEKSRFYDFERFRLDAAERVLFENGEPLNLPPKIFDTLLALVRKSNHIVERDELMNEVWHDSFVEEANLSVNISALRKTLGKAGDGRDFIETVPRRGYRFRAKITDAESDEMLIVHRRLQARIVKTEIEDEIRRVAETQKSLSATNTPIESLAVLPFRLIKVEAGDEYLSLSLADALITQLGGANRIVVRPTSAIKKFVETETAGLIEAGRALQVDAILECGVYRAGNNLRVTAMLIKTENAISIWSDKFDFEFGNIFAVQDAIAKQVADALTLKLNERERELLTKRYTTSGEAFREYLKGRYYWNKRDVENFYKAISHFRKAIDFDPTYALAYTGLADTYNMLPMWGELSPREGYILAKAAALKALEIDDSIADAHASLGYAKYIFEWDFEIAENSYRRAIALNPNCVAARNWYAKLFVSLKQFDEAREQMRFAFEIDPLSPAVGASVAAVDLYARRYAEAVEKYRRLLAENSDFVPALIGLGIAFAQEKRFAEAIAAHEAAVENSTGNFAVLGILAATRAMAGEIEMPLQTLDELKQNCGRFVFLKYVAAMIYARLGNVDEAFEWLEKAFDERVSHLADLLIDPEFDNLRGDERFDNLLRRIGLIDN